MTNLHYFTTGPGLSRPLGSSEDERAQGSPSLGPGNDNDNIICVSWSVPWDIVLVGANLAAMRNIHLKFVSFSALTKANKAI